MTYDKYSIEKAFSEAIKELREEIPGFAAKASRTFKKNQWEWAGAENGIPNRKEIFALVKSLVDDLEKEFWKEKLSEYLIKDKAAKSGFTVEIVTIETGRIRARMIYAQGSFVGDIEIATHKVSRQAVTLGKKKK